MRGFFFSSSSSSPWLLSSSSLSRRTDFRQITNLRHKRRRLAEDWFGGAEFSTLREDRSNNTTKRLYRILLQECGGIRCWKGAEREQNNPQEMVLLQPVLNPGDWGRARLLRLPRRQDSRPILSFFHQWQTERAAANRKKTDTTGRSRNSDPPFVAVSHASEIHDFESEDDEYEDHDEKSDASKAQQQRLMRFLLQQLQESKCIEESSELHFDEEEEESSSSSVLTSTQQIGRTIRDAFVRGQSLPYQEGDVIALQRWAIDAAVLLNQQRQMWKRCAITTHASSGARVIATSRYIGRASLGSAVSAYAASPVAAAAVSAALGHGGDHPTSPKYRFAYRIRVENVGSSPFQLLGRTWRISQEGDTEEDVVHVHAPTTGAVGHLPVIHPGHVFEYMSGCELSSPQGHMEGHFHMVMVDPDTPSAQVGEDDVFLGQENEKFELPVGPFPLVVD